MTKILNGILVFSSFVAFGSLALPTSSVALSVELAKKCRQMAIQAHPTHLPGTKNNGVEAAQRAYFGHCVATDGKMDGQISDQTARPSNAGQTDTPRSESGGNKMPTDLSPPETVPR